jgi:alcohol dehydrogenase
MIQRTSIGRDHPFGRSTKATGMSAETPPPLSAGSITITPAPTVHFGRGQVALLGEIVTEFWAGVGPALIVTDPFLAAGPVVAAVRASLESAGITVHCYDGVTPNPTTSCVDAGADLAAGIGATVIVPVGGGSSMDAAKGIALGAVNPQRGPDLDYTSTFDTLALPIVAVPTTSGTGAETNAFGVVTDVLTHRKFYVGHRSALARAAVLDPDLTVGLPPLATAATGMDAITHAIESFSSVRANPFADGIALEVVRTVSTYLPRAVADGTDIEARAQLMFAAHIAGIGMGTTGLGLVHALAHPLGGRFNIPHGLALCTVIGDVLRFNLPARVDRTERLAFALGVGDTAATPERNAAAAVAAVDDLVRTVGMTARLSDLGVTPADLDLLAADALADAVIVNTPVRPTHAEARAILETAL